MKRRAEHILPLAALVLLLIAMIPSCRRHKHEAMKESEDAANTNEVMTMGDIPAETSSDKPLITPRPSPPTQIPSLSHL